MRAFIRGVLAGYDTNSNLVRDPATGGVYAYDSERELTSATVSGRNATLAYDPLGRLDSYSATVFSRFVYDPMSATGAEASAEVDSSGNIVRRFVRGDGADEILTEYAGATDASPTFMHADERGSVIAATDASANPLWINRYDEYGTPQAGNNGWFQYTGQQWLWEVGLYNDKARIYSPALGRFLQPDPVGYDAGPNVYAYVLDDPVSGKDPSGNLDCSLEANWRSGNCADEAVAEQVKQLNEQRGATASQIGILTHAYLDLFHGETDLAGFVYTLASSGQFGASGASRIGNTVYWMNVGSIYSAEPSFVQKFHGSAAEAAVARLMEMLTYGWETAQQHRIPPDLEGYEIGEGLPNGPLYERYWVSGGTWSDPRLITPGGSIFYYAPYHYRPGPGVPTGFIEFHAVLGTPGI